MFFASRPTETDMSPAQVSRTIFRTSLTTARKRVEAQTAASLKRALPKPVMSDSIRGPAHPPLHT